MCRYDDLKDLEKWEKLSVNYLEEIEMGNDIEKNTFLMSCAENEIKILKDKLGLLDNNDQDSSIEYIVTVTSVSGEVKMCTYKTIEYVYTFTDEINSDKYWFISKIEKILRLSFEYDKEVVQKPLHFRDERYTEEELGYSFLKKDPSLININRTT